MYPCEAATGEPNPPPTRLELNSPLSLSPTIEEEDFDRELEEEEEDEGFSDEGECVVMCIILSCMLERWGGARTFIWTLLAHATPTEDEDEFDEEEEDEDVRDLIEEEDEDEGRSRGCVMVGHECPHICSPAFVPQPTDFSDFEDEEEDGFSDEEDLGK